MNDKGIGVIDLLASVILFSFLTILTMRAVSLFNQSVKLSEQELYLINKGMVYSTTIAKNLQNLPVNNATSCGANCVSINNGAYVIRVSGGILTTPTLTSSASLTVLNSSNIAVYCNNSSSPCDDGVIEITCNMSYARLTKEFKISNRIGG